MEDTQWHKHQCNSKYNRNTCRSEAKQKQNRFSCKQLDSRRIIKQRQLVRYSGTHNCNMQQIDKQDASQQNSKQGFNAKYINLKSYVSKQLKFSNKDNNTNQIDKDSNNRQPSSGSASIYKKQNRNNAYLYSYNKHSSIKHKQHHMNIHRYVNHISTKPSHLKSLAFKSSIYSNNSKSHNHHNYNCQNQAQYKIHKLEYHGNSGTSKSKDNLMHCNQDSKEREHRTRNTLDCPNDRTNGYNTQIQDKNRINSQLLELFIEIDHVFKHIQLLKGYGFSEKKITKWINIFLIKKSQNLRDIFLKSYLNKKSLNNSMIYQRWTNIQISFSKTQAIVGTMLQSERIFLLGEIKSFKNYIEQIVLKKAQSNLDQIFNIGAVNPIVKYSRPQQIGTNNEIFHFMKDLKSIQDRYGQLQSVSKVNRIMFKQILTAQQKFIDQFYTKKNEEE